MYLKHKDFEDSQISAICKMKTWFDECVNPCRSKKYSGLYYKRSLKMSVKQALVANEFKAAESVWHKQGKTRTGQLYKQLQRGSFQTAHKQQLFLPLESSLHSVALQGHVGLDPTSDRVRTLPHRIWPLHTPSLVSSASSFCRAVLLMGFEVSQKIWPWLHQVFLSTVGEKRSWKAGSKSFRCKKKINDRNQAMPVCKV